MQKDKLPPGQKEVKNLLKWGEDHPTINGTQPPEINLKTYTLTINGEVENPQKLTWQDIEKLPKTKTIIDFHCVEGWSVLNCEWEGIPFKQIIDMAKPKQNAKNVTFECADGYTTSLTINELLENNAILATKLNGKKLEKGTGAPIRLIIENRYAYKNAMWITKIKFTKEKELGYWEKRGYSDTADIWKNDRYAR